MGDGDPARLAQVLANLLNNAAKYTEEGGRISLTAAREGDEAVFRVRDTGVGIPAEMLPRVFDLFTQVDRSLDRSQGGLGIGLTLVRRLVEMHGGTASRPSATAPAAGSEFVVRLPPCPAHAAADVRRNEVRESRRHGGRRSPRPGRGRQPRLGRTASALLLEDLGHTGPNRPRRRGRAWRRPTTSAPTPWCWTSDCRDWTATRWPGGCGRRRRPIRRRAGRCAAASHRPDRLRPRGKPPPGQGGRLRPSLRQAGGPRRVAGPVRRARHECPRNRAPSFLSSPV